MTDNGRYGNPKFRRTTVRRLAHDWRQIGFTMAVATSAALPQPTHRCEKCGSTWPVGPITYPCPGGEPV